MRLIAHVPKESQECGIEWLILEEDKDDTGGVFLYCHRYLSEGSEFDSWHEDIDSAQAEAEEQWGVNKYDWLIEDQ